MTSRDRQPVEAMDSGSALMCVVAQPCRNDSQLAVNTAHSEGHMLLRRALLQTSAAITAVFLLGAFSTATAGSAMAASHTAAGPASAATSTDTTTVLLVAGVNRSSSGSTDTAAAVPNPAGCEAQIDDAHISTTVRPRSVKVNARIQKCKFSVSNLYLDVQLWKTGFIFDHLQAETVATARSGKGLKNEHTFRNCANTTQSRFYGLAYAQVTIRGTVYSATVQSPHIVPLACGT